MSLEKGYRNQNKNLFIVKLLKIKIKYWSYAPSRATTLVNYLGLDQKY